MNIFNHLSEIFSRQAKTEAEWFDRYETRLIAGGMPASQAQEAREYPLRDYGCSLNVSPEAAADDVLEEWRDDDFGDLA